MMDCCPRCLEVDRLALTGFTKTVYYWEATHYCLQNGIREKVMKRIYSAPSLTEVENMKNVLEFYRIESTISNQYLSVGVGGIQSCPELWVAERDAERALEIIETTDKDLRESQGTWVCTECNEEVEGQFAECWNCGKTRSSE